MGPTHVLSSFMGRVTLKRTVKVNKKLANQYKRGGGGNTTANESMPPQKNNGGDDEEVVDALLSQSVSSYEAVQSALSFLYKRAGVTRSQAFQNSMAQFLAGARRTIQKEKQELAQKITEGKEPMSSEVYEYIA